MRSSACPCPMRDPLACLGGRTASCAASIGMTGFRSTLRRYSLPSGYCGPRSHPPALFTGTRSVPRSATCVMSCSTASASAASGVHEDRLATEILELSVTYFPYAPSFDTPDGRGPNGRVTVAQSLRESTQPSTAGVSKPAHSFSRAAAHSPLFCCALASP